ncbi:Asp/Glu/Hydantoin racemase-domain-containing protein [Aspergillus heterothallicus]
MGACHPIDRKVKIMLLNPIGTSGFNDWTAETVIQYKDPKTHVTIVSLADRIGGSQTLAYPAIRPLLYAEMIRACLQARREKYDALIVNCFGDPMVDELRQIAGDMIVLGARQASLHTASRLGNKYAVILPYEMKGSPDPLHQRLLADTEAAVSHPVVDVAFNNDLTPRDLKTLQERLAKQGSRAVERDGAQVLILGCTAMLACWQGVMQAAGVPVVDPTVAALKAAAEAVKLRRELGWGTSTVKAENAPTKEELYMISQSEQVYPFSGRIEIE